MAHFVPCAFHHALLNYRIFASKCVFLRNMIMEGRDAASPMASHAGTSVGERRAFVTFALLRLHCATV